MDEWYETTIGKEVQLQRGFDITKSEQRSGAVPVVSSGGIGSYHDTAVVRGPGVVLGRKGTLGSVFYIDEDFWPHDTTLFVKDFGSSFPRFVYYFFKGMREELLALDVGTSNPALNRNHVHPIAVSWPPRLEQERIANLLGALDDKIALNRRMNHTLETTAAALFRSWFVDFDPVLAKAEGRRAVGVPDWLHDCLPSEFDPGSTEPIPAGWTIEPLSAKVTINEDQLGRDYPHPEIDYVDIASVDRGSLLGTQRVARAKAPSRARRLVKHGDVIWSCVRPNRASYFRVDSPPPEMVVSTGFAVLSPRIIPSSYLYCSVTTPEFIDFLSANAEGSAYPAVRPDVFARAQLLDPGREVLKAFDAVVAPLQSRAAANERENRTLAALRDTLLPQLLSGAIRLRDAERAVGTAI